jgi:radical SAM protein with 4Fe4S-binding SPASM domain
MMQTFEEGLHRVDLEYDTHDNDAVSFVLSAVEGASVVARIGLSAGALAEAGTSTAPGAPRAASSRPGEALFIPPERRWQTCAPDATVAWDGDAVRFSAATGGRPYLLKSAAIRCAQDTPVEVPVRVEVAQGAIEIGVLTASGGAYLRTFRFAEGRTDSMLFFDTGANAAVRLVISATPGRPVEAAVVWGRPRRAAQDAGAGDALRPPGAPEWEACVPAAQVARRDGELAIRWAGEGGPYLLKSNDVRCRPGRRARATMAIGVDEGVLGVGVLGGDGAAWLTTQILAAGTQGVALEFETGACDAVSFVLFAVKGAAVAARVSFPPGPVEEEDSAGVERRADLLVAAEPAAIAFSRAVPAADSSAAPVARAPLAAQAPAVPVPAAAPLGLGSTPPVAPGAIVSRGAGRAAPAAPETLPRQIAKWARGGTRYYCQKPWTDMSNFTVDGRVDVCCIATGASQEAYQLGNINRQSFQDIWNGPMARRFRRTVNGEDRLPPCARCPMSHAYNGLLFDPENTLDTMNVSALRLLRKRKLTWLTHAVVSFNRKLVDRVMFRGFKRRGNHVV